MGLLSFFARTQHTFIRVVWVALVVLQGCAALHPRRIAEPLPHFVQVDAGLYRGGQPSLEGIRQLAKMGVKTIVNLRRHSRKMDEERDLAGQLGMRWVNIPVRAWWRPSETQIRQFLVIAAGPASRPVFVHCRLGRNRSGLMVAAYRMVCQGWAPGQAYAEARRFGLAPWNLITWHVIFREIPSEFFAAPAASKF